MKTNPFSNHERALNLRALRTEILSSNIANADTPNYKARDIDFATAYRQAGDNRLGLRTTRAAHLPGTTANGLGADVKYRVPVQSSLDGNTVEADVEQAQFAANTVRYRASLAFLSSQVTGLRYAIKGGD